MNATFTTRGIKSIEYKVDVPREKLYGAGQKALDYTLGKIVIEPVKFTITEYEWINFCNAGGGITNMLDKDLGMFNMCVNYVVGPYGSIPDCDVLVGCMLKSWNKKPAEGEGNIWVDVEVDCLDIVAQVY